MWAAAAGWHFLQFSPGIPSVAAGCCPVHPAPCSQCPSTLNPRLAARLDGFRRDGFLDPKGPGYDDLDNMKVVLMELLATQGPIALHMDSYPLNFYYGGIIPTSACTGTQTNHGELPCILFLAASELSGRGAAGSPVRQPQTRVRGAGAAAAVGAGVQPA